LIDDDTPVIVDSIVQTIESGGLLQENSSQTVHGFTSNTIYTEPCLSGSGPNDDELTSTSYTQTILLK